MAMTESYDPISSFEHINPGDVLLVAKLIMPRGGSEAFWWKTFRVVTDLTAQDRALVTILSMDVNPAKDSGVISLSDDKLVVSHVPGDALPQGVAAMLMKAIAKGTVAIVPFSQLL